MDKNIKKIAAYILIAVVVIVAIVSVLAIWDVVQLENVFGKAGKSLFVVFLSSVVILFITSVVINDDKNKKQ